MHVDMQGLALAGQLVMKGVQVCAIIEGEIQRLLKVAVEGNLLLKGSQVQGYIAHKYLLLHLTRAGMKRGRGNGGDGRLRHCRFQCLSKMGLDQALRPCASISCMRT